MNNQDKITIDIVLQTTGTHGWNCSYGWVNRLGKNGLLNRVFKPVADWGDKEPRNDDGLFEYLKNPQSDIMILSSFDWHSQPLHRTLKWRERWINSPIKKIAILQEHYSAEVVQTNPEWQRKALTAIHSMIPCVNAIICNHEPDVDFLIKNERIDKPIMFVPCAIDTFYFNSDISFNERFNRAFFRGNVSKFFGSSSYNERRALIEELSQYNEVSLCLQNSCFLFSPLQAVQAYVDELKSYRLLLNLPSLSSTLTHRPFEIMGCGGLLLQPRIVGEKSNRLFQDWKHLVYYDLEGGDLIAKIKYLIKHPDVAQEIAEQGYKLCQQEHTIDCRINTLLKWLKNDFVQEIQEETIYEY